MTDKKTTDRVSSDRSGAERPTLERVFLSYRRSAADLHAERLYAGLARRLGAERVLLDIDLDTPAERAVTAHVAARVGACGAMAAVIGPDWSEVATRLEAAGAIDFPRLELEAALARAVPVTLALVGGAGVPAWTGALAPLASARVVEIARGAGFEPSLERLLAALAHAAPAKPAAARRAPLVAAAAAASR